MKIFKVGSDIMVAVCDKDIIGRSFKEGRLRLEVKEAFYRGALVSFEDAIEEIKKSTIANIVGNDIVSKAINCKLIHESIVLRISGVSHAQIIKV